jgi:hypothetical protein
VWLAFFKLELGDGWIKYRSLFGGVQEIQLADIKSAELMTGIRQYASPFFPPNRIEIAVRGKDGERFVVINTKVFSREALRNLRDCLQLRQDS